MLKGVDKISDFPEVYNNLEQKVEELSKNTRGIKIAAWIGALSTLALAVIGAVTFIITYF